MKKQFTVHGSRFTVNKKFFLFLIVFLLLTVHYSLFIGFAHAQGDMVKFINKRHKEIKEKEGTLKKEEERLNAIRKDVDERIQKYTKLLDQFEDVLKKVEQISNEKLDRLVKSYESMPPEEAAAALSAINQPMAVKIILKMKPKKVGAVMAYMDRKKVVSVTEGMINFEKKFPTK